MITTCAWSTTLKQSQCKRNTIYVLVCEHEIRQQLMRSTSKAHAPSDCSTNKPDISFRESAVSSSVCFFRKSRQIKKTTKLSFCFEYLYVRFLCADVEKHWSNGRVTFAIAVCCLITWIEIQPTLHVQTSAHMACPRRAAVKEVVTRRYTCGWAARPTLASNIDAKQNILYP